MTTYTQLDLCSVCIVPASHML